MNCPICDETCKVPVIDLMVCNRLDGIFYFLSEVKISELKNLADKYLKLKAFT